LNESYRIARARNAIEEERLRLGEERDRLTAELAAFEETQSDFETACTEFERINNELESDRELLTDRDEALAEWHDALETVRATLAEEQAHLETDRKALAEGRKALEEERRKFKAQLEAMSQASLHPAPRTPTPEQEQRRAMLDSLREVANLSARAARAAEFWQVFRRTLLIRVPPTLLLFVLAGILLAVASGGNLVYRRIAGGCFSLGLIALLDVLYFAATALLDRPEPAIVSAAPAAAPPTSAPEWPKYVRTNSPPLSAAAPSALPSCSDGNAQRT
jgi:hypothetical protein